jgi:protein O-GlcNAc transferase
MAQQPDNYAAEQALHLALVTQPLSANLWNQLGIVLRHQGRDEEAVAAAQRAIELDSAAAIHWTNLGNAHFQAHDWPAAIAAYQQAIARDSGDANVWNNLASAQVKVGALTEAEQSLLHGLKLSPLHPGLVPNYAFVLCEMDREGEAARWLQDRLGMNPNIAEAWVKLGELWQMMGKVRLAEAAYCRALDIAPLHPEAQYQLARMLRQLRRLSAAEEVVRQLLAFQPTHADGWALLGELLAAQGRTHEALEPMQQAVAIAPNADREARRLTLLQYREAITPEELLEAHRAWDLAYARPLFPPSPPMTTSQGPPLRIGFLSGDFGRHPIGFLTLRALEKLDREACSIVCYSERANEDEYTARFRGAAHEWRNIGALSDELVAQQIAHDRIDVLFDLMGHTSKRLLIFARKPAPLQIAWLAYAGTTGLTAMDGLIADRFHVREGDEAFYRERILRLPHDYVCYEAPADAPAVNELPALKNGYITFGCFNNAAKYSPRMLDAWAAILNRTGNSRLLLKANGLDEEPVAARLRSEFARRGVAGERIIIDGWSQPGELMVHYHRVDISLDTLPYSGGLTTCEALWMGVPVITSPGRTFAGRHSTSHLINAGCGQFVAEDLAGYMDLAVQWANDIEKLAALRSTLRDQVSRSPLCDADQFAADFLNLLRTAWAAHDSQRE